VLSSDPPSSISTVHRLGHKIGFSTIEEVEPSPEQDDNDVRMAEVSHCINTFNHKKPKSYPKRPTDYVKSIESLQEEDIKRLYVDPTMMPAQRVIKAL
jgi:hypothetical protein